jgi:hypothetical protein
MAVPGFAGILTTTAVKIKIWPRPPLHVTNPLRPCIRK